MKTVNQAFQGVTQGIIKSPFLWGVLGSIGFYALIFRGPLGLPLVERYFTKHPVEYMETVMFAIGLAALVLKALDTLAQRVVLAKPVFGPLPRQGQPTEHCETLLAQIDRLPRLQQTGYLVMRLRAAIEHIQRHGSAESLSDELKYLADSDVSRSQSSYGLFRVIVWAIPILGFLGTVIGITMALNAVDLQSPDQSMLQVLNGLGLKFDTTALALTLSMVLMFVHFSVERTENALLAQVDQRAEEELAGRFPVVLAGADGQLAAVRNMAETMLQAAEVLVRRQTELWQASMDAAAARWTQMANSAGERLHASLATALSESLKTYAQHLAAIEQANAERGRRQWDEVRQSQIQGIQALGQLQADVGRQVEILQRTLEATGEVTRLEDVLNRNLAALAGTKHFEQTVLSLAAALNVLGVRLAESPSGATPIKLEPSRRAA
jgi:biopolymer transport protein ExbB/TolQ